MRSTMGSWIRGLGGGLAVMLMLGAAAPATSAEAPCSADVREELALSARVALAAGRFVEAAELAERFARSDPSDARSLELLAAAYAIRRGLRHDEVAQADGALLLALGDGEHVDELLRPSHEDEDWGAGRIDAYLREHGEQLANARRVTLAARAGQIRWRRACDKGLLDDLCMSAHRASSLIADDGPRDRAKYLREQLRRSQREAARRRAGKAPRPAPEGPKYCLPRGERVHVAVYPRDREWTAAAQRQLERLAAVPAPPEGALAEPLRRAHEDAVMMAAVYLADQRFEALIGDDGADEAAVRELERRYRDLAASGRSPKWEIVALARIGQLAEYRGHILTSQALPRSLVDPAAVTARCDEIRRQAAPLYERAVAAYAVCHARAVAGAQVGEAAERCAEARTGLAPRRFPGLAELFGRAQYTASRPRALGVQLRP